MLRPDGRMGRRGLLQAWLAGALAGCSTTSGSSFEPAPPLAPIRARTDRIFDIAVCLRPFRPAGPRVETERLGNTLVVHNYGHGGSGWSLSWGSSTRAVQKAMEASPAEVAVIGCGALGLTSAILAQRAGAHVTIYARDQLPETPSARATGEWSPNSRIALASAAAANFADLWEEMARAAFKTHRDYLGLPGTPVEWIDQYAVSDDTPRHTRAASTRAARRQAGRRFRELRPADPRPDAELAQRAGRGHAVHGDVRRTQRDHGVQRADYGHTLMNDFLIAGGKFRRAEFHTPRRSPPCARRSSSTAPATARARCGKTRRSCRCAGRSPG